MYKKITNRNNTDQVIIIRLDRKTLIELNCTKYAQLIKKGLNDYYDDILSRITKQRSIIDEIIMSEFEQQRRQKLLDEDFYHYFQKRLTKLIGLIDGDKKMKKLITLSLRQNCNFKNLV